jgi:hypothetical protein
MHFVVRDVASLGVVGYCRCCAGRWKRNPKAARTARLRPAQIRRSRRDHAPLPLSHRTRPEEPATRGHERRRSSRKSSVRRLTPSASCATAVTPPRDSVGAAASSTPAQPSPHGSPRKRRLTRSRSAPSPDHINAEGPPDFPAWRAPDRRPYQPRKRGHRWPHHRRPATP